LTPKAIALNVCNNGRIELVIAELLGI